MRSMLRAPSCIRRSVTPGRLSSGKPGTGMDCRTVSSRSGFGNGSGRRRTASTTVKTASDAPIPRPNVRMMSAAWNGRRRSRRSANHKSCRTSALLATALAGQCAVLSVVLERSLDLVRVELEFVAHVHGGRRGLEREFVAGAFTGADGRTMIAEIEDGGDRISLVTDYERGCEVSAAEGDGEVVCAGADGAVSALRFGDGRCGKRKSEEERGNAQHRDDSSGEDAPLDGRRSAKESGDAVKATSGAGNPISPDELPVVTDCRSEEHT